MAISKKRLCSPEGDGAPVLKRACSHTAQKPRVDEILDMLREQKVIGSLDYKFDLDLVWGVEDTLESYLVWIRDMLFGLREYGLRQRGTTDKEIYEDINRIREVTRVFDNQTESALDVSTALFLYSFPREINSSGKYWTMFRILKKLETFPEFQDKSCEYDQCLARMFKHMGSGIHYFFNKEELFQLSSCSSSSPQKPHLEYLVTLLLLFGVKKEVLTDISDLDPSLLRTNKIVDTEREVSLRRDDETSRTICHQISDRFQDIIASLNPSS